MNDSNPPANCGLPAFLPASWRREWVLGAFLAVAVLVAYGRALPAGFVWDDTAYIAEDPLLTAPDGLRRIWFSLESPSQYFPLTYTTFYVERRLWGLNPAAYHLANLLLHAANALLLWNVLKRLRVPGAWLAAAIFALHPVQVESVAWISERKNVLMGFFFLLALLAWIKFISAQCARPWRFYVLTLVLYALALCAKTTACTLPAALLLILWLEKMPVTRARLAQMTPFLAMGIGMGLVSMWWERHHQGPLSAHVFDIGPMERVLIACHAFWFYLGKLIWPANLSANYPHWNISASDPFAYGWVLAIAVLAGVIWAVRRWTGRGVEAAFIFFAATLGPVLGFFMLYTFAYTFVADHYQYLACIGPFALAAAGITMAISRLAALRNILQPIICAILLGALGVLTWNECGMFANEETLWQTTLRLNPDSLLARANLGTLALKEGRPEEAAGYFQKALSLDPHFAGAHFNLGVALFQLGRLDEAIAQYNEELKINPNFALTHDNLGLALAAKGKEEAAIAEYARALALAPEMAAAHYHIGNALLSSGKVDEAISHLQKAEAMDPLLVGEQNSLGVAFAKKGLLKEAAPQFQKALEINPDDAVAGNNLAWLLATAPDPSLRDGAKALTLAQHVAELAGDHDAGILQTLAAAHAETGDYTDAAAEARRALELAVKQKNGPAANSLRGEIKQYENKLPARDSNSRWN